jgi:hypothetical protein
LMWRSCLGRVDADQVRLELEAQLAAARRLGFRVVGIDSHQHMHGLAPVSAAVLDVARQNDLQVRSLGMFITRTWSGRFRRALFGLVCSVSEVRSTLRPRRPSTWRERSWKPYMVASWEPITRHAAMSGAVVICHPERNVDVGDSAWLETICLDAGPSHEPLLPEVRYREPGTTPALAEV